MRSRLWKTMRPALRQSRTCSSRPTPSASRVTGAPDLSPILSTCAPSSGSQKETGSSPTSTSAIPTWARDPAGAALRARGPSGTAAENYSPQPNGVSYVLLVVNQARSESEDDSETRAHTGCALRGAQDQEPPARTLVSKDLPMRKLTS